MNKSTSEFTYETYSQRVVRTGIITCICAAVANFVPALYLWFAHGVMLDIGTILQIWIVALMAYGVSWIVQPVSYFPSLGVAATYVVWVCGNVADIRLPAAGMARKAAGVEDGTPQGDIISTIGITSSVYVSVAMISIFSVIGTKVIPMLPDSVTASFTYILPAVFAAVYVDLAMKNIKLGILSLPVGILLILLIQYLNVLTSWLMLVVVISGIVVARVCFVSDRKRGKL